MRAGEVYTIGYDPHVSGLALDDCGVGAHVVFSEDDETFRLEEKERKFKQLTGGRS